MDMKQCWIQIAEQKARTDYQDDPVEFLRGNTNGYSTTVDSYLHDAYEAVRTEIIEGLRGEL